MQNMRMYLEFDTRQTTIMSFERPDTFATHDIPKHHFAVSAGTDDTVILQPNRIYGALMTIEGTMYLQRCAIPYANQGVFRAGGWNEIRYGRSIG